MPGSEDSMIGNRGRDLHCWRSSSGRGSVLTSEVVRAVSDAKILAEASGVPTRRLNIFLRFIMQNLQPGVGHFVGDNRLTVILGIC